MTGAPRITVCIPTYNPTGYLHQAVHSVVDQTYPNIEVMVVDDASTRGLEYLDAVETPMDGAPERTVRVVRCADHVGLPGNWNRAIGLAGGDLIQVFHQDDLMDEGYLDRVAEQFATYPSAGFAFSNVTLIDADGLPRAGHWLPEGLPGETRLLHSGELLDRLTRFGNIVSCPSVVAKREVFERATSDLLSASGPSSTGVGSATPSMTRPTPPANGPFRTQLAYAADLELWLRLASSTNAIYIAEPYILQRRHAEQTSTGFESDVVEVDELHAAFRLGLLSVPEPFHESARLYRQAISGVRKRAMRLARRALVRGRLLRAGQLWGRWRAMGAEAA